MRRPRSGRGGAAGRRLGAGRPQLRSTRWRDRRGEVLAVPPHLLERAFRAGPLPCATRRGFVLCSRWGAASRLALRAPECGVGRHRPSQSSGQSRTPLADPRLNPTQLALPPGALGKRLWRRCGAATGAPLSRRRARRAPPRGRKPALLAREGPRAARSPDSLQARAAARPACGALALWTCS